MPATRNSTVSKMQKAEYVREATDETFVEEVMNSTTPVVADFWAEWCGPCRVVSPTIDQLASEFEGRVKFVKVNVDQNPDTTARYRVQSIPTVVFITHGREMSRIIGASPKDQYRAQTQKLVGA